MSGFWVLLRKELKEQFKTSKVLIVVAVFLFFGLGTPILTKYLPEIIKSAGTGGLTIEMPPPTSADSLVGYMSNMTQFGVLVAVLVAMGAIAREIETGTASIVLSKPVGRLAFILAKLKAESFTFFVALVLGGLACWGYTLILFGDANALGFFYQNLLFGLFRVDAQMHVHFHGGVELGDRRGLNQLHGVRGGIQFFRIDLLGRSQVLFPMICHCFLLVVLAGR